MKQWLFAILVLMTSINRVFSHDTHQELVQSAHEGGRLLVNIDSDASFSPYEFAAASSAKYVAVDQRNPFIALEKKFIKYPFIVISSSLDHSVLANLSERYGYRFIQLSSESLEEALQATLSFKRTIPQSIHDLEYMTPEQAERFYTILDNVDTFFNCRDINYWVTGGTLYGAVVFNGLLPWDDDLDVCIMDSDEQKLLDAKNDLSQIGLGLYYTDKSFYKIYDLNGSSIQDVNNPGKVLPYKYPFLDLFVMMLKNQEESRDIYVHRSKQFGWRYPEDYFFYSQIKNRQYVPFGPIEIYIPENPQIYLDRAYGNPKYPNLWRWFIREPNWSHKEEKILFKDGTAFIKID